jgi:hypothetical protein
MKTVLVLLAGLTAMAIAGFATAASPDPLDKLVGQPADISGSAYQYRSDRVADANPPESWVGLMQYAALPFDKKMDANAAAFRKVLCSLLWEEVRQVRKVELVWPAGVKSRPAPEDLTLAVCDGNDGKAHHWWIPRTIKEVEKPVVSADGCTYTYDVPCDTWNIVVAVKGEKPAAAFAAPAVRALGPEVWQRMEVEIEWGFDDATAALPYDGRVETYDAVVGNVQALAGDSGTAVTGATAWTSARKGAGRRGVRMSLFYIGNKGKSPFGHAYADQRRVQLEDVPRSIVTVRTKSGSFSFLADDLERGPILAPEYGYFVRATFPSNVTAAPGPYPFETKATTAAEFRKELAASGRKTVRQRVRERAEPTWESAMADVFGDVSKLPPIRKASVLPVMEVEVPSERFTSQWRLAVDHILDQKKLNPPRKGPDGKWRFNDSPYGLLASETYIILRALDLMGMRKEAADGLDQWLELPIEMNVPLGPRADGKVRHQQGTLPDRPLGLYSEGRGCFANAEGPPGVGDNMDGTHGNGAGSIAFAMNEHFRLTGDMEWLKRNVARMQANAEWILRQRRWTTSLVPGGERLWNKGLQPAVQISSDKSCGSGFFMQYYVTDAMYCLAVRGLADLLALVDAKEAARMAAEGEAYRKDVAAAVERSIALSPVVQTRDGTYHSFIPFGPYVRGYASGPWSWRRGGSDFPTYDTIWTSQVISPSGILPAGDVRAQGYLDTVEDRLTLDLARKGKYTKYRGHIKTRVDKYDPEKDYYAFSGFAYLMAWETLPNIYLENDDIPQFVRSFHTWYAAGVNPQSDYTFWECPFITAGPNKVFEEAGFLVRFRNMLVMEDGNALWLARGTPRAWLEQGKKINVKNAPTHFGTLAYEIVSDVDNGKINATVEVPSRKAPKSVVLRLRHPKAAPIRSVMVNGKEWRDIDKGKEAITLKGLTGTVAVTAQY